MADAAIGVVTEALLKTVISLVAEEVSLAWGVKKELRKVAERLEMIQALLSDAQGKQITISAVQVWLKKLKSVSLDAQIVLEEFSYQVLCKQIECRKRDKVRSCFSCSNAVFLRPKMAHKIKGVLSSLVELYTEAREIGVQPVELINSLPDLKANRLSTVPYVEDSKFVGREDEVANVIAMLTESHHERELPVVTILGMGGQGKTALAQMVYRSELVKSHFGERIWVCVSDDFDDKRLLADMLAPTQVNYQSASTVELVSKLKQKLESSKYLLVLDDVWNNKAEVWEHMRNCLLEVGGSSGSMILATTRSEDVASAMRSSGNLNLLSLTDEQSWGLFEKCAFADGGPAKTPQLVDIGKGILVRCGGVPLAIKTIGGTLYSNKSESDWLLIARSEMWSTYSGGDKVLAAIKLSYDHLPSLSVKQCFAYCAIFEKDTEMDKYGLIQLWMAQGFLNVPKGSHWQMEDLGDIYYNVLLRSSLLQDATEDDGEIECCTMHDLVHDVSLQISENHCLHIEDGKALNNGVEAVHISVSLGAIGGWGSLKGLLPSNLRTLYLKTPDLSKDMFQDLECVVSLTIEKTIENWSVLQEELPNSIGKMKLLRFLDVGESRITKLPEWLTKLYLLQSIRVRYLTEVPKGFGNLINLRHVRFSKDWAMGDKCLFKGLGKLRNLQTLPYFRVGRCEDECHIEELEHLNNLGGTLKIFGLQNVGSRESAIKSNLSNKSNIHTLELQWDDEREGEFGQLDRDDVAEGLKPCSTVKGLTIIGFQSRKCPSWVEKESLGNLVKLKLKKLNKCEKLPSLGDLPFLEELELEQLHNLRCIGPEFYGLSNTDNRGSEKIVFPALKKLRIRRMESLIEWSDAIGSVPSSSERVRVFVSLEELRIYKLPELCVFPNLGPLPNLRSLHVEDCKNMKVAYKTSCSSEVSGSEIELQQQLFSSLRYLEMQNCAGITAPLCSLSTPLVVLDIRCNPESWPKDLQHLSSLESLDIGGSYDGDVYEDDCLPWPYPYPSSHSTSLRIHGMESLVEWSDAIGSVPSSSERVRVFVSLEVVYISWLPKLCVFPNLGPLPNLRSLYVIDCENMKVAYKTCCSSEVSGSETELQQQLFSSLRDLYMYDSAGITAPLCSLSTPLVKLVIGCNPESWPKDLQHLSSLESLHIGGSNNGDVYEDDCLPWPYPYPSSHSTSLKYLRLYGGGLPRITILPNQIQYLTKLVDFRILDFEGLECIPEWLGNLECLQSMLLLNCRNLNQLPSMEAFRRLTNLRDLTIMDCPLLKERCKEGNGSDWPKIAHITNLDIY